MHFALSLNSTGAKYAVHEAVNRRVHTSDGVIREYRGALFWMKTGDHKRISPLARRRAGSGLFGLSGYCAIEAVSAGIAGGGADASDAGLLWSGGGVSEVCLQSTSHMS